MRINRRTMLKGTAAASAAAGLTASQAASAIPMPLVIYDSRIGESESFAQQQRADGARLVDIARAEQEGWPILRGALPSASVIEGLTGWSDWVAVRSELAGQGWRFDREDRAPSPLSGKSHLFRWSLKPRA